MASPAGIQQNPDGAVVIDSHQLVNMIKQFQADVKKSNSLDAQAKKTYDTICDGILKRYAIVKLSVCDQYLAVLRFAKETVDKKGRFPEHARTLNENINHYLEKELSAIYEQWKLAIISAGKVDRKMKMIWIGATATSLGSAALVAGGLILLTLHLCPALPFCLCVDLLIALGVLGGAAFVIMTAGSITAGIAMWKKNKNAKEWETAQAKLKVALGVTDLEKLEDIVQKEVKYFFSDGVFSTIDKDAMLATIEYARIGVEADKKKVKTY